MANAAPNNLLITGRPGVGKTTLVRRLAEALSDAHPVGFYTAEIRQGGERVGFELIDFAGRRAVLSHVRVKGPHHVGKYGVDLSAFESFLDGIPFSAAAAGLVVIDEIGKMECHSQEFISLLERLLDSEKPLLATVSRTGGGFIAEVKRRADVRVVEITASNRSSIAPELERELKRLC